MSANPITNPDAWDFVLLAGRPSPGIAVVSGGGLPSDWDKRKGTGSSGATLVYQGEDLSEFKVKLTFVEADEIDAWYEFAEIFSQDPAQKPGGPTPKALDFYHPSVSEPPCNIKSVVKKNVSQLTQDGDTGAWSVEITLTKFAAPKPAVGKPDASKGWTMGDSAATAADKQIAALTKQVKDLSK